MKLFITFILFTTFAAMAEETTNKKTLYFVRHSKSSHDDPNLEDFDRPLADRGNNEAPMMGKILNKIGIQPDLVISSPSQRTTETVKLFSETVPFNFDEVLWDKQVYAAPTEVLKEVIYNIDDNYNKVMVFGHNPSFTHCANYFQADTTIMNVPTSGIVAIEFDVDSWSDTKTTKGTFLFMEYPKKYR